MRIEVGAIDDCPYLAMIEGSFEGMCNFLNVRKMVLSSIFASLIAVCAWISIPVMEVGFTLQLLGIFLALGVLGGRWGTVSILTYLFLGAVGLPVFSGFRGGLGMLLGPGGGYLTGFLAAGLIYWLAEAAFGSPAKTLGLVLGLLGCYSFGTLWFSVLYGISAKGAVLTCVAPYLIPDLLKLVLAKQLSKKLRRYIPS